MLKRRAHIPRRMGNSAYSTVCSICSGPFLRSEFSFNSKEPIEDTLHYFHLHNSFARDLIISLDRIEKPKPAPKLKRLDYLAGRWTADADIKPEIFVALLAAHVPDPPRRLGRPYSMRRDFDHSCLAPLEGRMGDN